MFPSKTHPGGTLDPQPLRFQHAKHQSSNGVCVCARALKKIIKPTKGGAGFAKLKTRLPPFLRKRSACWRRTLAFLPPPPHSLLPVHGGAGRLHARSLPAGPIVVPAFPSCWEITRTQHRATPTHACGDGRRRGLRSPLLKRTRPRAFPENKATRHRGPPSRVFAGRHTAGQQEGSCPPTRGTMGGPCFQLL